MSLADIALIDLVIANRVLARLGVVDAYGHVRASWERIESQGIPKSGET
jgi:hypothetical protein